MNLKLLFIIILSCFLFLSACNNSNKIKYIPIEVNSYSIKLEQQLDEVIDFYILNNENSIDIFALDKKGQLIHTQHNIDNMKVPMESNFNSIGTNSDLKGIFPISSDSILFLYDKDIDNFRNNLILLITKDDIGISFDTILNLEKKNILLYTNLSLQEPSTKYNNNNDIFFRCSYLNKSENSKEYFLSKLNIQTKDFNVIPFPLPDSEEKYKHLITSRSIWFDLFKDNIITSFPLSPIVYIYMPELNEIHHAIMDTKHNDDFIFYSQDEIKNNAPLQMEILEKSFRYTSIIWDNYKKKFLRFYELELEEKQENGDFSTYGDKKIGVTIYDNNYNYLGDCILGTIEDLIPNYKTFTITPNGIIYLKEYDSESNTLYLNLLKY